jgi:outer membrane protein insertion porin family
MLHATIIGVVTIASFFSITARAQPAKDNASTQELTPPTICDQPVRPPAVQPPVGSGPVIYLIAPCFSRQGGVSVVDAATYLHYVQVRPSQPSQGVWVPFTEDTRAALRDDFRRLWATNFLDDLSIEVHDYVFANGVVGKLITYDMEERQRVRIVDYTGANEVSASDIEEALKKESASIAPDAFLDQGGLRRVDAVIRTLLAAKGYQGSVVTHDVSALPQGPKLVHLTFAIAAGPKYRVRRIEFVGNEAISDRTLKAQMKDTKDRRLLSWLRGGRTYKEDTTPDDLERVVSFYRDRGFLRARVDAPEVVIVDTSQDHSSREVQLRIHVSEGPRYRVGEFVIADNTVVKSEPLKGLFKVKGGEFFSEKELRRGLDKAREIYGAGGYFEFTAYPSYAFRDEPPIATAGNPSPEGSRTAPPIVDVTLHMQEGMQYFVNRITFKGNIRTRDNVIRREMQLVEAGVFNTEALKYSVRRINQLGYFRPLAEKGEREDVKVEKTPGEKGKVDVTLLLDEQNRNEVSFGAGVSGVDGLYAHASYATSNFLGLGETLSLAAQQGARGNFYQAAITEPYVFGWPISVAGSLSSRKTDYYLSVNTLAYSEVRTGATGTLGFPLGRFLRAFGGYSYEVIDSSVRDGLFEGQTGGVAGDPLFSSLLDQGRHIESRINPTLIYNTVDSPLFPRRGMRLTASYQVSGGLLGGTVDSINPEGEAVLYIPHLKRTAFGLRAQSGWVRPYADTTDLPYYRRYFLGGETQIRGVNIRTVGPLDAQNRALGGNKFVLFNAEYYIDITRSLRALVFHDAGQAFSEEQRINLRELRTSSGVEVRFLMPVMNVPFRLIYAWNVYRDVFQPARGFKFAVGTTF